MGEGKKPLFEPSFNRAVKVRGGQDRLTSDAGTLLLREADHRLGLTQSLAANCTTAAIPIAPAISWWNCSANASTPWPKATMPRTTWTSWPTIRPCGWPLGIARASGCRKSGLPASPRNRACSPPWETTNRTSSVLRETLADWSGRHLRATGNDHAARRITIDIDSFPIQAYG